MASPYAVTEPDEPGIPAGFKLLQAGTAGGSDGRSPVTLAGSNPGKHA